MLIRRVVEKSEMPQALIARDSGLSYAAIRAWVTGQREPQPESIGRLAGGLRRRAEILARLAEQLEREAER